MEVTALLKDVDAGRLPRLLLVHGPEPLLVEELLDRLTAAILPDAASAGWNREVVYADTPPDALVASGVGLPLFGEHRLVIVRGLGEAPARIVERFRAALDEARARAGGWPAEGTTVLLIAGGADRRAPALRLLPEREQVEVRAPTGRGVVGWLRERARGAGLTLTPEAAQTLVVLIGEDLGRLAGEIEKAAVYSAPDERVTEDVVRALVGETRVRQYWELTQALEGGKRGDALRLLELLLDGGDEPVVLLAWLMGYVRTLWRVLAGLGEAADARQIGKLLKPPRPEWVVERLMTRASAVGTAGVTAAIARGFEVERALKTSAASPRPLLTLLVAELAR